MNSRSSKSYLAVSAASSSSLQLLLKRQLSTFTTAFFALALGTTTAQATVVDLTIPGGTGSIGAATFTQFDPRATGTGMFNTFVQVSPGGNNTTSSAYNTTANGTFDVGSSAQHNRSIFLSDVPVINGSRRFVLDVNETNSSGNNYLSLDQVRLYVGGPANSNTTDLTTNLSGLGALGQLVYSMNTLGSNTNVVGLNYDLNTGSGAGDMFMLLPDSLFSSFSASSVVTLYSAFGGLGVLAANNSLGLPAGNYGQSDGFEEWAAPGARVPDGGSTIALMGVALLFLAGLSRRGILVAAV